MLFAFAIGVLVVVFLIFVCAVYFAHKASLLALVMGASVGILTAHFW